MPQRWGARAGHGVWTRPARRFVLPSRGLPRALHEGVEQQRTASRNSGCSSWITTAKLRDTLTRISARLAPQPRFVSLPRLFYWRGQAVCTARVSATSSGWRGLDSSHAGAKRLAPLHVRTVVGPPSVASSTLSPSLCHALRLSLALTHSRSHSLSASLLLSPISSREAGAP